MSRDWRSDEREMADLLEEMVRADAIPDHAAAEVERLYAEGKYHEGLLCALAARD